MVIVPIVMYSSMISLQLTSTQKRKLQSLSNRAKIIIGGNVKIKGIENRMMMNACNFVKQCLDELPSIRLEFGKKSFRFQGAKIYNDLPLEIRESPNAADFRRRLTAHFDK